MNKININGLTQEANCEQLDALAHDYLGVQTSLDDESYGCRKDATMPFVMPTIQAESAYPDAIKAFAEKGITVNTSVKNVRIMDNVAKAILLSKVTHATDGVITEAEMAKLTSITGFFEGNSNIKDLSCLVYSSFGDPGTEKGLYNMANVEAIGIPSSLTKYSNYDGRGCFSKMPKLKKVIVKTPVTISHLHGWCGGNSASIGPFEGGAKLYLLSDTENYVTELDLTGATYIGGHAFTGLKGVTKVIIPSTVTYLGYNTDGKGSSAFVNCSATDYYFKGKTPPTLHNNGVEFNTSPTFHVPSGCTSAYTSAGYSSYGTIVEDE